MSTTPTRSAPAASTSSMAAAPAVFVINTVQTETVATNTELTPEEQWALFEFELKYSDSGHQPC
ncbi:MAG: hypothetical protein Q7S40_08940 [Opitutaceae bacterium]|nr:hypothetical protein [Opitutaceae bacterium]